MEKGREVNIRYLKWKDTVIGEINALNEVDFLSPDFNEVVRLYTNGERHWS